MLTLMIMMMINDEHVNTSQSRSFVASDVTCPFPQFPRSRSEARLLSVIAAARWKTLFPLNLRLSTRSYNNNAIARAFYTFNALNLLDK